MRLHPAASSIAIVLAIGTSIAGQDPVPVDQPPAPEVRRIAELSDLLTHSTLAPCPATRPAHSDATPTHLRVATWNIRAARSAPLEAISSELQAIQADVIALQEVDMRTSRTGFVDEPAMLAAALGFQYVFAASIKWDEGDYGLAVLSRWPIAEARRHRLDASAASEPRIVLEATICAPGRPLRLFNHHADGRIASRDTGLDELRAIVQNQVGNGILVLGDFNERPDGAGVRALVDSGLVDLGAAESVPTARPGRIDYLLADAPLARLTWTARVWTSDKSDHNALVADLQW